jgi:spermidine synthase
VKAGLSLSSHRIVPLLLLASGAAGLIYEQVWIRWLSLVFGMASPAIAVTVSAFFLGMALGARFGPGILPCPPLRAYAIWEVLAALGAVLIGFGVKGYPLLYPSLYSLLSPAPTAFLIMKLLLALLLLLPATIALGASLPVLARGLPQKQEGGGRLNVWYAANTAGAALGAALAGLGLPLLISVPGTYAMGLGLSITAAIGALLMSRRPMKEDVLRELESPSSSIPLMAAAFLSGVAALSLEVLWTRLFAQVLPNSVFSFTVLLLLFLISYSLAPLLANRFLLPRMPQALWILTLLCAGSIWLAPQLFYLLTARLEFITLKGTISSYLGRQAIVGLLAFFPPLLLSGMILPAIWNLRWSSAVVSPILFSNLLGASCGALLVGLGSLHSIGLFRGTILSGFLLGMIPLILIPAKTSRRLLWIFILVLAGLLADHLIHFPLLRYAALQKEKVLELRESRAGILSVTEKDGDRRLRLDNFYLLGATAAAENEERQAHLPLLLHPHPERVAFLGSGTGITPGAALLHPIREITVVEIIPAAWEMGQRYFSDYCHRLYADPRVRVVLEDARNVLLAEDRQYDVIVSDLYVPWHVGAGNLYTREYFDVVKSRLAPRGIFCQELALYQISPKEFLRVTATLQQVFPRVTLWHCDFYPHRPVVCLIAQRDDIPFALGALPLRLKRLEEKGIQDSLLLSTPAFFMLWIGRASSIDLPQRLNSDQWPRVEFLTALDQMRNESRYVGAPWVEFCRRTQAASMADLAKYLGPMTREEREGLEAGPDFLAFISALLRRDKPQISDLKSSLFKRLPQCIYRQPRPPSTSVESIQKEIEGRSREMTQRLKLLRSWLGAVEEKATGDTQKIETP